MSDDNDEPTRGEEVTVALGVVDHEDLSELLIELLVEAVDAERGE
ncbi:hypothetical protein [Salinigranum salinum]|nr:hypothetical protein [Salinigranum salinum]